MTLLAAFKDHGNPLLIGDFLLTRNEKESGLKKKIHLISSTLVIGWTGHLVAANMVLQDLYKELGGKERVSRNDLERFLKNYSCGDLGICKVRLVGWLIEKKPHCFLWNSEYPTEIFYENEHNKGICAGTGEKIFNRLIAMGGRDYVGTISLEENIDAAIAFAFKIVGELFEDEIKEKGVNRDLCFGYAYEILYYEPGHYKYVDNVLYVAWDFYLDDKGNLLTECQHNKIYKYWNYGNCSVIGTIDSEKNEITYEVIEPVCGHNEKDHAEAIKQTGEVLPSLRSHRYCIFFQINPDKKNYPAGTLVVPDDLQHSPLKINRNSGIDKISIDKSLLQYMYKHIEHSKKSDDYSYYK